MLPVESAGPVPVTGIPSPDLVQDGEKQAFRLSLSPRGTGNLTIIAIHLIPATRVRTKDHNDTSESRDSALPLH
jgi:hypothetical protein